MKMDKHFSERIAILEEENKNLKADKEALIAGQESLQKYISEQKAELENLQKMQQLIKTE